MSFINISDDDDPPKEFRKEYWIGQGHEYPSDNVPIELNIYIQQISSLSIGQKAQLDVPDPYLTFLALAERQLPYRDNSLVHLSPQSVYQKAAPNVELAWLKKRDLPSKSFVNKVDAALGQAVLDGARSIRDPRSEGAFLPLGAVSYWRMMHRVLDAEAERDRARTWLVGSQSDSDGEVRKEIRKAITSLDALPWGAQTMIAGANRNNAIEMAILLSSGKVNTSTVDMMVHWIMERVEENDELASQFEVFGLELWQQIDRAENGKTFSDPEKLPKLLKRVRDKLEGGTKRLLFPVFVSKLSHFVAMQVDFESNTFSYGDTLHHLGFQLPSSIRRKVRWFLNGLFDEEYEWTGCSLSHGRQDDYRSCGVGAANIIAATVLSEELYAHERRVHHRVRWFLRLAQADNSLRNKTQPDQLTSAKTGSYETAPSCIDNSQRLPTGMAHLLNRDTTHKSSSKHQGVDVSMPDVHSDQENFAAFALTRENSLCADEAMDVDVMPVETYHTNSESLSILGTPSNDEHISPTHSSRLSSTGNLVPQSSDMDSLVNYQTIVDPSCAVEAGGGSDVKAGAQLERSSPKKTLFSFFSGGKDKVVKVAKKAGSSAAKAVVDAKKGAKKRGRDEEERESDDERPNIKKRTLAQPPKMQSTASHTPDTGSSGISRTSVRAHIQKEALADGSFKRDPKRFAKFEEKIREIDPRAMFHDSDILLVQHNKCGEYIRMEVPYQVKAFKNHVHGRAGRKQAPCNGPKPGPIRRTQKIKPRDSAWNHKVDGIVGGVVKGLKKMFVKRPCPGLRAEGDEKVGRYLERTPASGGGGPSVARLTLEYHPNATDFSSLTPAQKADIRATQHSRYRWRNETALGRVVSHRCLTSVQVEEVEGVAKDSEPCSECRAIREDKNFKVAISHTLPNADNFKYTPKVYLGEAKRSAEKYARTTGLKVLMDAHEKDPKAASILYAEGVAKGEYEADKVFTGFVESMS